MSLIVELACSLTNRDSVRCYRLQVAAVDSNA